MEQVIAAVLLVLALASGVGVTTYLDRWLGRRYLKRARKQMVAAYVQSHPEQAALLRAYWLAGFLTPLWLLAGLLPVLREARPLAVNLLLIGGVFPLGMLTSGVPRALLEIRSRISLQAGRHYPRHSVVYAGNDQVIHRAGMARLSLALCAWGLFYLLLFVLHRLAG